MTKTRRLAAIMAVDVIGYSRPMGEESWAARLVGERRTTQFVTCLLSRMVLRCLGDWRSCLGPRFAAELRGVI
jgi:hypothetical protein